MLSEVYEFLASAKRPLLVVLGPTASGKTNFSITLALSLIEKGMRAEIVNADSRQLYRTLDIGTAKITNGEMQGVPHHLIDVLDPNEECTAAQYKEMAEKVIDEILGRGNIPALVGGSMLYISAIIDGLEFAPVVDPLLRKKLEEEYDRDRGATLYARLQELDPETGAAFHSNNKPYVIRAMELIESGGATAREQKKKSSSKYDLFIIGMDLPREILRQRISDRLDRMFEQGWINEVQSLLDRGYSENDPAMKSHGYKEIMQTLSVAGVHEPQLREEIAAKSRQYAKRQMTWWKGDERIHWIDPRQAVPTS